ncbi:MAG TPA: SDR family NAD(P)-dependent oxidoreductase, partial [Fibrobacteria bacterium]|nr:SDR family NAD(P)-dependent oxidoreductase [Fibrobacteria bacterium]
VEELKAALKAWLDGDAPETPAAAAEDSGQIPALVEGKDWRGLARAWARGAEVDWTLLHKGAEPRRINLPTYAFEKRRHWVETANVTTAADAARLHPLLHRNSSDLERQSYVSTFTGEELFLADHRVEGSRVLPAVAYLEMVRAALAQALPRDRAAGVLEIRDAVWAQPIVVAGPREVTIALASTPSAEDGPMRVEFEISSREAGTERIHCTGHALAVGESRDTGGGPGAIVHDLGGLAARMQSERIGAESLYAGLEGMGLAYGPAHRAVTGLVLGEREALARLAMPECAAPGSGEYLLHPSLMDGALQAAVPLLGGIGPGKEHPPVPFALESLRLHAPCRPEMTAWIRPVAGSPASPAPESMPKLDIDLCDADGKVCVELRGYAARMRGEEPGAGLLLAVPEWSPKPAATGAAADYAQRRVILCALPGADAQELAALVGPARCVPMPAQGGGVTADLYAEAALSCLEALKSLPALMQEGQERQAGRALIQIAIADREGGALFAGLSAMLKTAAREMPRLDGQFILMAPDADAAEAAQRLNADSNRPEDSVIRYASGERMVERWREIPAAAGEAPLAFREDGVYLITGGLGGLGLLFTREILARTRTAKVIVTGRAESGPEIHRTLEGLDRGKGRVAYRRLDLGDPGQVRRGLIAIRDAQGGYGRLDGILHAAGMVSDRFLLKKDAEEFRRVLEPKVQGTWNLDAGSRDFALDFFALFSSVTSALGNAGQIDYAAANGFMDRFAGHRNRLADSGERQGRTVSIHWPLWRDGGMRVDAAGREQLHRTFGMRPLRSEAGLRAFHQCLAAARDRVLVMEGHLPSMRDALAGKPVTASAAPAAATIGTRALEEPTLEFLRREISAVLKIPVQQIEPRSPFEDFGVDSMLALNLVNRLEKTFGSLSKTLFFEYQNPGALAAHLVQAHGEKLADLFGAAPGTDAANASPSPSLNQEPGAAATRRPGRHALAPVYGLRPQAARTQAPPAAADEPIAIVGLSGRYPEAPDLRRFWRNLRDGKDCIVEVPADRWDWREYFSADRNSEGNHFSRYGGFISGVDEFDPLFFGIPPVEAELMDPQERLFLQHAWMAIEDAGYSRAALQIPHPSGLPGQVGVYAGVMYS